MRNFTRTFIKDEGGNFSMMFSVMGLVLLTGVGFGVDMQGAAARKASLQNMADMATLAAISAPGADKAEKEQVALDFINAQNINSWSIVPKAKFTGDNLSVTIDHDYDTMIMGIVGKKSISMDVEAGAVSAQDTSPVDIAFVLDRTGSMTGSNMASLQGAANELVTYLENATSPGSSTVRMSVVPFADYVNVGMANIGAVWIDTTKHNTSTLIENIVTVRDVMDYDQCTMEDRDRYSDGVFVETYQTEVCPNSAYGPEYERDDSYTKTFEWFGCAGSRPAPMSSNPRYDGVKINGKMNNKCGEELLPLTNDLEAVKAKIQSLTTSGETYLAAGLQWGWRTLDPSLPFDEIAPLDETRRRAMIFMTDGANTKNQVYINHDGNAAEEGEKFAIELCDLIKQDDIIIYTVAYNFPTSDQDGKATVQNCATSNDTFFDVQTDAQLKKAFLDIGKSLSDDSVRLTR